MSADAAVALITDGMTVCAAGFGGFCHPEALSSAVERRFLATDAPRDLTLLFAASTGDRKTRGMGHFAHEGLVRRVIAGGWRGTPRLGELALAEKIEAHCWPQGVIAQLYRAIAAGQPGVVTRIGLGSFIDPALQGGRMNASTPSSLVERVRLRDRDWLLYPAMNLDCALLRGTTADEDGNIAMEEEAFPLDSLAMAQAVRNSGGLVFVQVKRIATRGSIPAVDVVIPANLVDHIIVCEDPAEHALSFGERENPAYTGRFRGAARQIVPLPLTPDKLIQRRAFLELLPLERPVVNLGIGLPAGVGRIALEEGFSDFELTIESGVTGGIPAEELSFGASFNPSAIISQAAQFDFYDGGGLDIAFLGMAEVDTTGIVNVSRFGRSIVGVGGFTHIAQSARRIVFLGTFSNGDSEIAVRDGRLDITRDGRNCKIVDQVMQISADPGEATSGQTQKVITERCVFEVIARQLTLTEVAPGIDVRSHILDRLPPGVAVADHIVEMDAALFATTAMKDVAS